MVFSGEKLSKCGKHAKEPQRATINGKRGAGFSLKVGLRNVLEILIYELNE